MVRFRDDCLALLSWAAKNPDAPQSYRILERETGVPIATVAFLIDDALPNGAGAWLPHVAADYHYEYSIYKPPKNGKIIDAIWNGYESSDMSVRIARVADDTNNLPPLPCGTCDIPDIKCTFRQWFEINHPERCLAWCPFYITNGGVRDVYIEEQQ